LQDITNLFKGILYIQAGNFFPLFGCVDRDDGTSLAQGQIGKN
jgi:hypothetical protein